ncbi:unnamed protein product [Caenorhabditis brenneri]
MCSENQDEKHEKQVGWVSSSWAGRISPECSAVEKLSVKDVYLGDGIKISGVKGGFWQKDAQEIENGHRHMITENGDLVILDMDVEDGGTYECVKGNVVLMRERVVVHGKLTFSLKILM